jgi:hypothetical protein
MKRHPGLIAIILAIPLMTSACQPCGTVQSGEADKARTYYESLNLATPENAVQTFANAFQREDFMTVYLVLSAEAQRLLRIEYAQKFNWRHLIGENADERLWDDLDFDGIISTTVDPWYLFDQIMLYAAGKDDLLIDLRGGLDILRSEESMTREGGQAMDVIADVEGVSGEVVFRLVTDRDDRWRVYLVSAPDEGVDSWPSTVLNESP